MVLPVRKLLLFIWLVTGSAVLSTQYYLPETAIAETLSASGIVTEFVPRPRFTLQTWSIPTALPIVEDVVAGDLNGDRCADLISKDGDGELRVFLSDCKSTFKEVTQPEPKRTFPKHLLASGYIDRDSCADLLASDSLEWVWLHSNCNGTFSNGATIAGQRFTNLRKLGLARVRYPMRGFYASDMESDYVDFSMISPPLGHMQKLHLPLLSDSRMMGTGDVDGDGLDELFIYSSKLYEFRALKTWDISPNHAAVPWRASFNSGFSWPEIYFGDFNGDGKNDVLARGSGIAGWWIAHSNGKTGLEEPVYIALSEIENAQFGVAGDFNGDGFTELLRCARSANPICQAAQAQTGAAVAGVTVTAGNGTSVQTDSNGAFAISFASGNPLVITPTKPGYQFSAAERTFRAFETKSFRSNFIAVSDEELRAQPGRTVHIVPVPPGPKVCVGYFPYAEGRETKWSPQERLCPSNFIWVATDDNFPNNRVPRKEFERGYCCPLPAEDILLPETVGAKQMCPDNTVVVGLTHENDCDTCKEELRCAPINQDRYTLGPQSEGVYYGQGASSRFSGRVIPTSEIPAAIRIGIARMHYDERDVDGCIGDPPASAYIGNSGHGRCDSHLFRQLRYSGRDGDPIAGTPVQMFPDCSTIADPYDPLTGCNAKHKGN